MRFLFLRFKDFILGFTLFGIHFFDFTSKVTYADAFLTIALVCGISFIFFLFIRAKSKHLKGQNND